MTKENFNFSKLHKRIIAIFLCVTMLVSQISIVNTKTVYSNTLEVPNILQEDEQNSDLEIQEEQNPQDTSQTELETSENLETTEGNNENDVANITNEEDEQSSNDTQIVNEEDESTLDDTNSVDDSLLTEDIIKENDMLLEEDFMEISPASSGNIVLTATLTTNATPLSGETFNLTYMFSGVAGADPDEKIQGLQATITIPPNIDAHSDFKTNSVYTVNPPVTNPDGSKTYTIVFKGEPTPGNNFAQLNIPLYFKNGENPSNIEGGVPNEFYPVLNITGTNIDPVTVDKVNAGTETAVVKPKNTGTWNIYKAKISPTITDTYVGIPNKYYIQLTPPSYVGGVDLDVGAKVIDKLPPEATFIEFRSIPYGWTASYDSVTHTATWTNSNTTKVSPTNNSIFFYIDMKYENPTGAGETVSNIALLDAKYVKNGSDVTATNTATHKVLDVDKPKGLFFQKTISQTAYVIGEKITFNLYQEYSVYEKTGSTNGFKEIVVVDDPLRKPTLDNTTTRHNGEPDFYDYFDFSSVIIKSFPTKTYAERNDEEVNASDINIKIEFQTKMETTWHEYSAITKPSSYADTTITESQLLGSGSFDTNDEVTLIKVTYTYKDGTVSFPGNFKIPQIIYVGIVKKDGSSSVVKNTAYFYTKYWDDTYNVNKPDTEPAPHNGYEANYDSIGYGNDNFVTRQFNIVDTKPYIENNEFKPNKTTIYQSGENVNLSIKGRNYKTTGSTTSTAPYKAPEDYILIPANFKISAVNITTSGFKLETPINSITDPDNTSLRQIIFSDGLPYKVLKIANLNGEVALGQYWEYRIDLTVPPDVSDYADFHRITMSSEYPNLSDYIGSSQYKYTNTTDIYDLNQDGDTTTFASYAKTSINLLRELKFTSQKYVGATQASYDQYTSVPSQSDFYYKIEMTNESPFTSADKLRAIDILPYAGDTLVFATTGTPTPRGSEWAPTNYSLVSKSQDVTVYSTETLPTPDQIRLELENINSSSSGIVWTAGVSPTAKAIKIERATSIASNETVTVELKAKAPNRNLGEPPLVSWNSFAYGSIYNNGLNAGINMPVAEPPKVAVYVTPANILKLSGVIWNDANDDGIRDTGEELLSGQKVSLYDQNGFYLGSKTTDATGAYEFSNLASEAIYTVKIHKSKIVTENIYGLTTPNVGSDTTVNSDFEGVSNQADFIASKTVTMGTTDMTNIDAGLVTNSISGVVWFDENSNATREDTEQLLSNVKVKLYDQYGVFVSEMLTDTNGFYKFDGLKNQKYTLKIEKPTGFDYKLTLTNQGTDVTIDSDYLSGTDEFIGIVDVVVNGTDVTNIDAGFKVNGISGMVWFDENGNGTREQTEQLLENIKVKLYDQSGIFVAEKLTDSTGAYKFDNLTDQKYTLKIEKPLSKQYNITQVNTGLDTTIDSDYLPVTGEFIGIVDVVVNGLDVTNIDAGLTQNSINGVIWYDYNRDGIRDTNEKLLPGTVVELYDASNQKIQTATTDDNGVYSFLGVSNQTYTLKIISTPSTNFMLTKNNQGTNSSINSDYVSDTSFLATTSITVNGQNITNIDAGLIANIIEGIVWYDVNKNGIKDGTEQVIPNIKVELYDEIDVKIDEIDTDENGFYRFEQLGNKKYTLKMVESSTFNYGTTKLLQGDDQTVDSHYIKSTDGYIGTTMVVLNNSDVKFINAGLITNDIQGCLWQDYNKDGIRDVFEPYLQGMSIQLYDKNGLLVATTTTDANGAYRFDNVKMETYTLKIIKPANTELSLTKPKQDSDNTINSDYEPDNQTFGIAVVEVNGEDIRYIDAGFVSSKTSIFINLKDPNGSVIKEGEFDVYVKNPDGTTALVTTVTSDEYGNIVTEPLPPGEYIITQKSTDKDYLFDSSKTYTVKVTGDEPGMAETTVINKPKRGVRVVVVDDKGKPYKNATVTVTGSDGTTFVVTTNELGEVYTDNLPPGTYTFLITVPNGYTTKTKRIQLKVTDDNNTPLEVIFDLDKPNYETGSRSKFNGYPNISDGDEDDYVVANINIKPKDILPEINVDTKKGEIKVEQPKIEQPKIEQSKKEEVKIEQPQKENSNKDQPKETKDNVDNSNKENNNVIPNNNNNNTGFNAIDMNQDGKKLTVDVTEEGFIPKPNVYYYEEFDENLVPTEYKKVKHTDSDGTPYWTIEREKDSETPKKNPKTGQEDVIEVYKILVFVLSLFTAIAVVILKKVKKTSNN